MRIKPVVAFYLICGLLFIALSGRSEGLASPRYIFVALALVAVGHLLYCFLSLGYFATSHRSDGIRSILPSILGIFLYLGCATIGLTIDNTAIRRTQERGDRIIETIASFHASTGDCPSAVDDLYAQSSEMPSPALRNASYYLNDCTIWFESALFTTCERSIFDEEWTCVD